MTERQRRWGTVFVFLAVLAFDQTTKVGYQGILHEGIAGSKASMQQTPLHLVAAVVLTAIFFLVFRRPWWALGLAGGALVSNMVDRILLGGVRNPVAYGPLWWNWADLFALIGTVVCVYCAIVDSRRPKEVNDDFSLQRGDAAPVCQGSHEAGAVRCCDVDRGPGTAFHSLKGGEVRG